MERLYAGRAVWFQLPEFGSEQAREEETLRAATEPDGAERGSVVRKLGGAQTSEDSKAEIERTDERACGET